MTKLTEKEIQTTINIASDKLALLIEIIIKTKLRISEILNLKMTDIIKRDKVKFNNNCTTILKKRV